MALSDEVITRLSTQRLRELTTADDNTATTYSVTRLAAACTDAKNEFLRRTGVTYSETNSEHHTVGVKGVIAYLYEYKGLGTSQAGSDAIQEWRRALEAWARTDGGANQVVQPQTNSGLMPETDLERGDGGRLYPDFDRPILSDLVPRQPKSGRED